MKAALQAALPVLQDYASSNPMHFYRGAWHDPRGVHAAVKLVTAALGVGEATMADELTVEQKRVANVWDHIDDVLPVIEAARAGKWTPYENMACKYIELRIDMRDGGCIIKNAKGERINPSDLRRQPYGHGFEPWPKGRPPLATWQRETIAAMAAPDGAQEVPRD
ncbi:MAG TPA: hypothetical protein VEB23_08250 [Ramlibacter sp.]|nr:hypothetical protein [Ramlibacter sp.]